MRMIRAFIALPITPKLRLDIQNHTIALRKKLSRPLVRWVAAENVHLTLKFLGNVSDKQIAELKDLLNAEVAQHAPFTLQIGGIGAFPSKDRPRVIWVGVEKSESLFSLQKCIERVAGRIGVEAEKSRFAAHLTIGRVNQRARGEERRRIRPILDETNVPILGKVTVKSVHLFQSELKTSGAVYYVLHRANLEKKK